MQSVILKLDEPQSFCLEVCNQSITFTLELIDNKQNILNMVVVNVSPRNIRLVSKDEAKAQIQRALMNIKKGVVRF